MSRENRYFACTSEFERQQRRLGAGSGVSRRLHVPVFIPEPDDSRELVEVVRHQSQVVRDGRGRDHEIVRTDRCAQTFRPRVRCLAHELGQIGPAPRRRTLVNLPGKVFWQIELQLSLIKYFLAHILPSVVQARMCGEVASP